MTNPAPHGQVPEALIDLIDAYAETRHRCGGVYNAKTEAARKAVIEALSGVQALSTATPTPPAEQQAQPSEVYAELLEPDATTYGLGAVWNRHSMRDFADRTHALRMQAAPKAAPGEPPGIQALMCVISSLHSLRDMAHFSDEEGGELMSALCALRDWAHAQTAVEASRFGSPELQAMIIARCVEKDQADSGFDHKTAADLLNNKTVSDEAVRKFVAVSRWAHDEKTALSATLLAMHGVLTSREAEIALLKKALLEAETAPQPAAKGASVFEDLPPLPAPEDLRDIGTTPQDLKDYLRGYATEYAKQALRFSQPAPAPLSEREAFERDWEKRHAPVPTNGRTHDDGRYGDSSIQDAWESWQARAALAAQGGK